MRNLLALVAFLVLTVGVVGWCRDWYHVRTVSPSADGHRDISIDIDQHKIVHDMHKGEKEVDQVIDSHGAKHHDSAPADAVTQSPVGQ